jgi:hypothetical protein
MEPHSALQPAPEQSTLPQSFPIAAQTDLFTQNIIIVEGPFPPNQILRFMR